MTEKIDVQSFITWLNSQWPGAKSCPICKKATWNVSEKPVELREFHGGDFIVGGPLYPLFLVTCQSCGYTLLFNAVVSGFVSRQEKKEEK